MSMINETAIPRSIAILHRKAQRFIANELREYKIGASQYGFLLRLYRGDGVSQERLSNDLYIDKSATKRIIDALEKAGYVYREKDYDDKRAYKIFLTEKAIEIKPKIMDAISKWNNLITKGISTEQNNFLIETLDLMLNNSERGDKNE